MTTDARAGYWSSPWPGEDNGPTRRATTVGGPQFDEGVTVVHREAMATTMVVLREPGEVFALRHTAGPGAIGWVERIDAVTLETQARSDDLEAGPVWPGGVAVHANGDLYTVFGNHAHRLSAATLEVIAKTRLPRVKPYNSFVILPDGHLVTKDFGGVLPGHDPATHAYEPTEMLVLEPDSLAIVARCSVPEASIARLSSVDDDVYLVGVESLWRLQWDGTALTIDESFTARYCTIAGQTYGWDPVIALGAVWFLDNGFGSERYAGTFRNQGVNLVPLHLVRVDLETQAVSLTEICGLPGGVVANPPIIDEVRRIAVGYDSGNGVIAAFDVALDGSLRLRWRRDQNHACHPLLFGDSGDLVTADHDPVRFADDIVLLDVETGDERARVASGSPVQSVLFPAAGFDRDLYYCSFTAIARVS